MEFYALVPVVQALEAELACAGGPVRVTGLVAMAWHLRQRDSAQALRLAREAAGILDLLPSEAERRALRFRLALTQCEVAALFGQLEVAEQALADARRETGKDPEDTGDALLAEAVVAKARGQRPRELDAYDRAAEVYSHGRDATRAAIAAAWAAYERTFSAPAETDDNLPQRADDHPALDALRSAAGALRQSRREPALAIELFLRASEQSQRAGMLRHAVVCTINAGTALQGLGELDQAAACFDIAEAVVRAAGWPPLLGTVQTKLGAHLAECGRLEDARELLAQAVASLAGTASGINHANACSELANTLLRLGRGVEAIEPMAAAIRAYRQAHSTDNLALTLIYQAKLLSSVAQPDAALAAIDEARALIDEHGLTALTVAVHETLAEIHRRHQRPGPQGLEGLPNASLYYGEAALREGRAIAGWHPPATLLIALADDWAAAGDAPRALGHAREALAALQQEIAQLKSRAVELHLVRTMGALPRDAAGLWRPSLPLRGNGNRSPHFLTPKELDVLQLLARSYSNKEIAVALDVGDETVKWHLKKLYAKLDAGSRRHAVAKARMLGILGYGA